MLSKLYIKNYALIKNLEINFDEGLNIITGETGAGKSILLGALGLLLGSRADTKTLYDESEKCVVEGEFDISKYELRQIFEDEDLDYEQTCFIRREISAGGKSRAFINDTPVNLDALRKVATRLIDIHSQHDTILLGSNTYQLAIVDTLASNQALSKKFRAAFNLFKKEEQLYQNLLNDSVALKREYDFDKFLFEELQKAKLVAGEQDQLETELNVNEHAEEVKSKLAESSFQLSSSEPSVLSGLYGASSLLNSISKFSEKYLGLKSRVDSVIIELKDIVSEIEEEGESVSFDPEKIEQLKEKLNLIYSLQKKHNVSSVEALLEIQASLETKLEKVQNLDDEIADAQIRKEQAYKTALTLAEELSLSRKKVVPETELLLISLLQSLGISNASLKITQSEAELSSTGMDEMKILFSANKGIAPQELKNVASGGEFSRLMLSLKYAMATKIALPTIVFDEIDTGVSGEISIKMGKMMKEMSSRHQVVAITHLPQIACQGEAQYFVYKDDTADRTVSKIRRLTRDERVIEIAKMIGGERPTATAISNAKELLGVE